MGSSTTPSIFSPDFAAQLVAWEMKLIQDSTVKAYQILWGYFVQILIAYWLPILGISFLALVLAFLEYVTTGRWARFGSTLYWQIFYAIHILIGFIFGPQLFANDWFPIISAVIGLITYTVVGKVLKALGAKSRW